MSMAGLILSAFLAPICVIMVAVCGKGADDMYSKEYEKAKKEFINCLCMSVIGLGVPVVLAFREWWPIMQREKQKALEAQKREK